MRGESGAGADVMCRRKLQTFWRLHLRCEHLSALGAFSRCCWRRRRLKVRQTVGSVRHLDCSTSARVRAYNRI